MLDSGVKELDTAGATVYRVIEGHGASTMVAGRTCSAHAPLHVGRRGYQVCAPARRASTADMTRAVGPPRPFPVETLHVLHSASIRPSCAPVQSVDGRSKQHDWHSSGFDLCRLRTDSNRKRTGFAKILCISVLCGAGPLLEFLWFSFGRSWALF